MKVIVTGAAVGIGFSIAKKLCSRGAQVLVVDKDGDRLAEAHAQLISDGSDVVALVADLRDVLQCSNIVNTAVTAFGGLTGVVSNAGAIFAGPISTLSLDDYENCFAVNTRATWLLGKAAYPHLVRSRGALVALASIGGEYPSAGLGAYSASKAALIALVKQMAVEWGAVGVRCNCVSPGATLTSMFEAHFPIEEDRRRLAALVPLKRLALPEDIANGVAYLLGPESDFISGTNLVIDGGYTNNLLQLTAKNF